MSKKAIKPEGAAIVGPYSPAVEVGGFVFCSGQIPVNSASGKIESEDIKEQFLQCLNNLTSVLKAASLTSDDVVKTTVYLTDMKDYALINQVYGEYFKAPYPARTAVAVVGLPLGAKVEIEVVAKK